MDTNVNNCRLICLPTENKHYGNGFIVSNEWSERIHRYWKISDRISVIQLKLKDDDENTKLKNMKLKIKKINNEYGIRM